MSDNTNTNAPDQLPPAGWYPDPHDPAAQRYWDGAQWTAHAAPGSTVGAPGAGGAAPVAASGATVPDAANTVLPSNAVVTGGAGAALLPAKRAFPKLKWWQWLLIGLGVLVLISIIVNGVNGDRASDADAGGDRSTVAEQDDEPVVEEEPVETVDVPDVVGSTVAEARAALEAVGLTLVPSEAGDDWIVTAQDPAAGEHPVAGLELSITSEEPKPVYTLAQQNAIDKAQSYLDYTGFSRTGLISQLEYEGFSTAEATFGADNAGADWNAEAAEKAESYLEYTSFSRQGLYDQLAYEGFTDAQIQFGLAAVGY